MLESAQAKIQGALRKAVAAITAFMLGLILLAALLITGFYLLVQAAILGLQPHVGEAAALALVGLACVLLLAGFFWRLAGAGATAKSSRSGSAGSRSSLDGVRELIRENPLEAALTAFAVGIAQQGDPRLKSLLMQGGMELMKQGEGHSPPAPSDPEPATSSASEPASQASGSTRR